MKKEDSEKPTVLLSQYKNDGFLDFYYSKDLKRVMEVLDELINDR